MTITVKLFATLRKFLPPDAVKKSAILELSEDATTDAIVEMLNIPAGQVHLILIDGKHAVNGSPVHDGAVVSFFPAIAGG